MHYFATVCLMAAVTAEAVTRRDFNLELALLEKIKSNATPANPDMMPNWMRGFFDDFTPEPESHHQESWHEDEY